MMLDTNVLLFLSACFLWQMPYIIPALVDSKICADGRKELIEWLTKQMTKVSDPAELVPLIKPMALSLQVT